MNPNLKKEYYCMKKRILICISVLLVAICIIGFFTIKSFKIVGYDGLIAKARKEINLAEADTIEMVIAGKSTINSNTHLFWFVTGNEYQMNRPHSIEFIELENNEYEFAHRYNPIPRGQDIYVLPWHGGYSFFVNNPKCKTIRIDDYADTKDVEVTEYPFIYYNKLSPREYLFLDENGNEIK